jgi:hypothetical protein
LVAFTLSDESTMSCYLEVGMLPSPTDDGKDTAALNVHARHPMPRFQALFLVTMLAY